MPRRQKRDATEKTSYWRGACGEIRPALESRIKHNTLEGAFTVLKSRKQGRTLLLGTFCSVPGFTNTGMDRNS